MNVADIYQTHHEQKGRLGFSVLEQERARWFLNHIPKGAKMLDLGCRDATLTKHFQARAGELVGVDVDSRALEAARANCPQGQFLHMDLLGDWKELQGQQFDVILCSEVLEHVYFPERVADHIRAYLAPGGVFIGSVPNAFFLKHRFRYLLGRRTYTPLEDPTHITQFNERYLREILSVVSPDIQLEGYTRPPMAELARHWPGMFAFDFLFAVKVPAV